MFTTKVVQYVSLISTELTSISFTRSYTRIRFNSVSHHYAITCISCYELYALQCNTDIIYHCVIILTVYKISTVICSIHFVTSNASYSLLVNRTVKTYYIISAKSLSYELWGWGTKLSNKYTEYKTGWCHPKKVVRMIQSWRMRWMGHVRSAGKQEMNTKVRNLIFLWLSALRVLFLDKKNIIFIQHFVYKNTREEMIEDT
jgi:hypothetical protein